MNSKFLEMILVQIEKGGSFAFIVVLFSLWQLLTASSAEHLDLRPIGVWGYVAFVGGFLSAAQRIVGGRHVSLQNALDATDAQFSAPEGNIGKYDADPLVLKRHYKAVSNLIPKKQRLTWVVTVVILAGAIPVGLGLVTFCLSGVSLTATAFLLGVGVLIMCGGLVLAYFFQRPAFEDAQRRVSKRQKLAKYLDDQGLKEGEGEVDKALALIERKPQQEKAASGAKEDASKQGEVSSSMPQTKKPEISR